MDAAQRARVAVPISTGAASAAFRYLVYNPLFVLRVTFKLAGLRAYPLE